MNEVLLVMCNAPDAASARAIAVSLVESRCAACVNIGAPCESIYWWEGKMEAAFEVPLAIKTTAQRYTDVEAAILSLHPHQVPEIIAVPVVAAMAQYLEWVRETTAR